jgi:Asp-tRNA(Asn)/Glu-tRNA(Gln) amidotransferase C subunit
MEKVERMGKASPQEMLRLEAVPLGNKMAARLLNDSDYDFDAELAGYKGTERMKYVVEGAMEIFLRNISLPRMGGPSGEVLRRAKRGILALKENKKAVETIFEQLENLFNYYEQARQQAFNQVKQAFEQHLRTMGQQVRGDVTAQQQFAEEWRRVSQELDSRYEQALAEQKQRLLETP